MRRWLVRPVVWTSFLIVVLVAGAIGFVHSEYALRELADLVRSRLSDAVEREVQLSSVDYDLWTPRPSLELHDLVIPGPRRGDRPVLRASLVRLQVTWTALRSKVFDLEQVEIVRPQIYLELYRDGSSNLPRPRRTAKAPRFEVRIGHLALEDGVLQLNERRSPLAVEARALWGRAVGVEETGSKELRLDARLTTQDLRVTLPNARPYPFTFSARGSVTGGKVTIARALLSAPELSLAASGAIGWGKQNQVELAVNGTAAARWVNDVGFMAEPIDGPASFAGRFELRGGDWRYWGTLESPRVAVLRRQFLDLAGDFAGDSRRLTVGLRRARYADGDITGRVVIETGAAPGPRGGRPVELDLLVRGLALQPFLADLFPRQFAGPGGPVVELSGRASGRVRYRFPSAEWRLGAGTAGLRLEGGAAALPGRPGLAVGGELPLALAQGVLTAGDVVLTAPGQQATVSAFRYDLLRDAGRLDYRLTSGDTGGLIPLFPPVRPKPGAPPPVQASPVWLPTAGHGTASGAVTITPTGYSARMDLDLRQVASPALGSADRLHGGLTIEPLAIEGLRLEASAGGGALLVTGRIPLARAGRAEPDEPIQLGIDASDWPAAGLAPYLPAGFPVAGVPGSDPAHAVELRGAVSGRLDLGGNFERLTGRGDVDASGVVVSGVQLGRVRGELAFDPGRFTVEGGLIDSPAGKAVVRGTFERASGVVDATIDAPSLSLAAEPLRGASSGTGLTGRIALMAAASGTLDRPRAMLTLRGQGLAVNGRPLAGAVRGAAPSGASNQSPAGASSQLPPGASSSQSPSGAPSPSSPQPSGEAQVTVSLSDGTLRASGALAGLLSFEGGGRLDRRRGGITLDVRSNDLGGLLRLAATPQMPDLTGSFAGSLVVDADLAAGTYGGELRLADLRAEYAGRKIANREPVVASFSSARLVIRSFYLGETGADTELFVSGSIGLGSGQPLDLRLQSTISASWARLAVPNLDLTGAVDVLATLRGTLAEPLLNGQAGLHGARLIVPGLPNAIEDIDGTVLLYRDRLVMDGLRARLGGGTLRVSGQLTLPAQGRALAYRAELSAQDVSVRFPEGWVSRGDAQISLAESGSGRQVQGLITLSRALYVEKVEVDALQLLLRGLHRERLRVAATTGALATTQLNLAINGPGALRVRNNVADVHGDIELTVVGTLASPVLFGFIQLEPGGSLVYADTKYSIERGTLTFANPNRIDPVIDLGLKTQVQSYDIALNLSGTVDRLNAKFASSGDLADLDILALLATGQRPETRPPPPPGSPEREIAGQTAAAGFLAGQASSALSARVGRLFGLDRLRIDTTSLSAAGQPTSGVVIIAGKRLSKNVFVTYVSTPNNPHQDVRQIEWQAARSLKVLLTQSAGSYAVDFQLERRF
ncbi:MAG TPA: translocation/assembly module TamB domain-containing protein [Thermoanaerobaculia bacterium]|nr:translocation/assembly module TamB domain-containing protein [Thermoanaerobaculia bacterium]